MHKTTILLPEELQKRSRAFAQEQGISLSELIRRQLEKVTRAESTSNSRSLDPLFANWRPSGAVIPADLSANHDHYLYDE